MNVRGYTAIGLYNVKNNLNVGSTLRAAGVYGASLVATTGGRYKKAPTDTFISLARKMERLVKR